MSEIGKLFVDIFGSFGRFSIKKHIETFFYKNKLKNIYEYCFVFFLFKQTLYCAFIKKKKTLYLTYS